MSFLIPATVAACVCVRAGDPLPLTSQAEARGALFLGTAVTVQERATRDRDGVVLEVTRDVTFVVHRSWQGVQRDTVTVSSTVAANCGSYYVPGSSYLVLGDFSGGVVETGDCDSTWSSWRGIGRDSLMALPPPGWVAERVGRRSIDEGLISPGQPPLKSGPGVLVGLGFWSGTEVESEGILITVADTVVTATWARGASVRLPVGHYRARFTTPFGQLHEIDLWVQWDGRISEPGLCLASRMVPPPELWGDP